jgi:DNA-binding transcriptional LysR family regulator
MELAWLEDFIALNETGNFSRAAELRHVTQPAFSRRIRALEDWVGTPLFERTPQGTRPTPAGEQFARGAPGLVRTITDLRRDARAVGGRETATLHFAATHSLSFTFFPGWLRGVERVAPVGPVRLVSDSMQACEELMLQGQSQFVLCHHHPIAPSRLESPAFASRDVGEDSLVPLTAPDADGQPRWRLDDADGDLPLLAYSAESGLGRIVAANRFEQRAPTLRPVFSAQLAATLLGMARGGSGIAWLPASLAADDVERGSLVPAGGTDWAVPVGIRLYRPTARQSAAAERFWSHLPPA